jgi:G3E family GTPase
MLTGFLGSGKTTLLNAALRDPRLRDTVVIVNELGDVGLDHLLIAGSAENVVLLDSGCLCCGLLGSLRDTLLDLHARRLRGLLPQFARVVVETSGLADPAPALQSLLRDPLVVRDFRLEGVVATIDALLGESELDNHAEAVAQLCLADRVVVTKTDLCGGSIPGVLRSRLRALNPVASERLFMRGDDAGALLPATGPGWQGEGESAWSGLRCAEAGPTARHDGRVRSDVFLLHSPVSWAGLAGWIELVREHFGARLLRCKGLVRIQGAEAPVVVQGVQGIFAAPRALESAAATDARPMLVCIHRDIDPAELRASLRALDAEPGTHRAARLSDLRPAGHS